MSVCDVCHECVCVCVCVRMFVCGLDGFYDRSLVWLVGMATRRLLLYEFVCFVVVWVSHL